MKYYNKLSQKKTGFNLYQIAALCLDIIQREKIKKSLCIGLEGGDWLTQFLLADMSAINLVFYWCAPFFNASKKIPFFSDLICASFMEERFFCGSEGSTPTPSLLVVRPLKKLVFFPLFNKNIFFNSP